MEILFVTGMSGAGKSSVINALEDIGFFCVDNLPPSLLKPFLKTIDRNDNTFEKVAVVIDSRTGENFKLFPKMLDELIADKYTIKVLFVECDNEVLIQRYKETRRKHPLAKKYNDSVIDAIQGERELLSEIKKYADMVIDSTNISVVQFREKIKATFVEKIEDSITVHCISFGYKFGVPRDCDLVFDVRCLPNPFYIPELKNKTGLDKEVYDFVLKSDVSQELLSKLLSLIDFLLPLFNKEGKSQLVIGIGCTGGKHRSVTFAREIAEHVNKNGYSVTQNHRDALK